MHTPRATYRLQLSAEFDFAATQAILPYLAELGISDIYASPIFRSRRGSAHGYDLVDPNTIDPELGGRKGFERLARQAAALGLGWLQDIVPNHMAFDQDNRRLADVLENGQKSAYADFFDIDWQHPSEPLRGRLLAPFLGRPFGEALEAGEIGLEFDAGTMFVTYYQLRLPLAIRTYVDLLEPVVRAYGRRTDRAAPDYLKLLGLLGLLRNLDNGMDALERRDQARFAKTLLAELQAGNASFRRLLNSELNRMRGHAGEPSSFDGLEQLLARQHFRLAYWKVATEEINYRRFFNINDLIGVRVEQEEIFDETHALIGELVRQGLVQGLRVDHVDGLYDPLTYLNRLRRLAPTAYLVVEKILGYEESLPLAWPVAGTTGYDFIQRVTGLLVDASSAAAFDRLAGFCGVDAAPMQEQVANKKRLVIGKEMAGDVDNLARLMKQVAARTRHGSDITIHGLKRAIVETLARFPVYRSYVAATGRNEADGRVLRQALREARRTLAELAQGHALDFLERFLLADPASSQLPEDAGAWLDAVMRFQQLTGPLMAKGFEDTFLYCHPRLLALNEVGGSPAQFGVTPAQLHAFLTQRTSNWPQGMNASASHDSKRGEDARARLAVLSELPREFTTAVRRWRRQNRSARTRRKGQVQPDRLDEYLLYQTLVGHWPLAGDDAKDFPRRLQDYLLKAVREAKRHSSWVEPDEDYEQALLHFVDRILTPGPENLFLADFVPFAQRIAQHGVFNSLSQTLIKLAAPGVPDFYQGTELLDYSFVDPDNRRPVDYRRRQRWLAQFSRGQRPHQSALLARLLAKPHDGRAKLLLIARGLALRRELPALFSAGDYQPLAADGTLARHVFAFARHHAEAGWVIAVAPRLTVGLCPDDRAPLGDIWRDSCLPLPADAPGHWHDVISGRTLANHGRLPLREVLAEFPVALLRANRKGFAEAARKENGRPD